MKHFLPILILLAALFSACSSNNQPVDTTSSSVAKLKSFAFAPQDSFPGLKEAVFRIEERLDTGLVYNVDSIRFGTPLTRVVPKFTFVNSVGSATMRMGDSLITLTGKDTLDFTLSPIYLTIQSSDLTTTKVYEIRVSAYTRDPELYTWTTRTLSAFPPADVEQRVLRLGDTFCWFTNDAICTALYRSTDLGTTWTPAALSGLPDACRVGAIISLGDTVLYYAEGSRVYTSRDAASWNSRDLTGSGLTFCTMAFAFREMAWAVAEDAAGGLQLVSLRGDTLGGESVPLDDLFPVSGFATVNFTSTSDRERVMLLGGYARNGQLLHNRWNIEYSVISRRMRITDYAIEQPDFETLSGVSVLWYNNSLLMLGGMDRQGLYAGNTILCSLDEGLNWAPLDSTKSALPDTYTPRRAQQAFVHDRNIYVFGGQNNTENFTDVYRGRLNSID